MRVALITNVDQPCGNAEYGKDLARELSKRFEVNILQHCPEWPGSYGVVLVNWHPAKVGVNVDLVRRMQAAGAKVILLIQESFKTPHHVGAADIVAVTDLVLAHEPMNMVVSGGSCNFRMIPHPAVDVSLEPWYYADNPVPVVGTAGFAFATKRMDVAVRTALALPLGQALVIAPGHPWCDPRPLWAQFRTLGRDRVTVVEEFLPEDEVVRRLSHCAMNVYFAEEGDAPGQSGSARMILAAKRPTIMRRCNKTSALFQYEDEINFVSSEKEVEQVAHQIWHALSNGDSVATPDRVVSDISWTRVGSEICDLLEELVGRTAYENIT